MSEYIQALSVLVNDYTFLVVLCGTSLLGALSGVIGCFIVLRQEALVGDCVAHASYPGIVGAFLWSGVKELSGQLLGALLSATVAIMTILIIKKRTRLPSDGLLATILSGFFGFGLVLMTIVQKTDNANQAGLNRFILGQASTILLHDVVFIGVLGCMILALIIWRWQELSYMTFDSDYARTVGIACHRYQYMLGILSMITVLLSIQSVGIILMSALLIAPAVSARQWTSHLRSMVILAAILGASSAATGTIISSLLHRMPTGPSIAIVISGITFISLLVAPKRGLLWR